jgi:enolase-phosphatase E1
MTAQKIRAIVTDIEGTATSISFVKDSLFPYARSRIGQYLAAHRQDEEVLRILADARTLAGDETLDDQAVIELLVTWSDADRKITPLKALQGLIWTQGFRDGELVGDVYDDAARGLREWRDAGYRLYVYSSGSILAQKLVFGHTPHGDLATLFSGFFDTTTGPKLEADSYGAITAALGLEPGEILFLSDSLGELDAAREAGLKTVALDRGEAVIPPDQTHPLAQTFDAIDPATGTVANRTGS